MHGPSMGLGTVPPIQKITLSGCSALPLGHRDVSAGYSLPQAGPTSLCVLFCFCLSVATQGLLYWAVSAPFFSRHFFFLILFFVFSVSQFLRDSPFFYLSLCFVFQLYPLVHLFFSLCFFLSFTWHPLHFRHPVLCSYVLFNGTPFLYILSSFSCLCHLFLLVFYVTFLFIILCLLRDFLILFNQFTGRKCTQVSEPSR